MDFGVQRTDRNTV